MRCFDVLKLLLLRSGFLFKRLWFFVFVKLVGVDYVVPDAVETSGYCSDRSKECVADPYGEYSVFLTERLSGCYSVVVSGTDFSAEPELENTTGQWHGHEPQLNREFDSAMRYAAGCGSYCESKSDGP